MRIFSSGARWRAFSGVLLLVFLLRAVIPSGFMPAQANGQAGIPGMTFCIAGLPAGVAQNAVPRKSNAPTEAPILHCVFSAAASQAVLPLAAPALTPAVFYLAYAIFIMPAAMVQAHIVRGPPLGSRAPPYRA
ncbi:hypothetical protein V0R37_08275 [Pollutimonas sp. H1-120]|uniref:hypothetical protein n=1 Tax=Pollutimonas sp. H1-120 TaxID=3148824 RepID=UPI003B51CF0A